MLYAMIRPLFKTRSWLMFSKVTDHSDSLDWTRSKTLYTGQKFKTMYSYPLYAILDRQSPVTLFPFLQERKPNFLLSMEKHPERLCGNIIQHGWSFYDHHNLDKWLPKGSTICLVEITDDSQVFIAKHRCLADRLIIKEPLSYQQCITLINKRNIDDFFIWLCQHATVDDLISLDGERPIPQSISIYAIHQAWQKACQTGRIDIAQWLFQFRNDFPFKSESAFIKACGVSLTLAQWLNDQVSFDRLTKNDGFISACKSGRLDVVEWLQSIREIDYEYKQAFLKAFLNDHLMVAQYLVDKLHIDDLSCVYNIIKALKVNYQHGLPD